MFIQVLLAVKNVAVRRNLFIPPGPARFLDVILQGIGNFIVDHLAHIFFINTHTKGRGGHNDGYFPGHKGVLVFSFFIHVHLAVVRPG
ncbi:MAG: hypothetical protein BWY80_00183 [Firmicutes bacterium ADurb.Bin456]|nr:MAG: hypothetical protein BWY80_00183 [Firmicutes bacterium ADurb.Bin456]